MDDSMLAKQVAELAAERLAERPEVRGNAAAMLADKLWISYRENKEFRADVMERLAERLSGLLMKVAREEVRPQMAKLLGQSIGPEAASYARRLVASLPEPGADRVRGRRIIQYRDEAMALPERTYLEDSMGRFGWVEGTLTDLEAALQVGTAPAPAPAPEPAAEPDRWMVVWHTGVMSHVFGPGTYGSCLVQYEAVKTGGAEVYLVRVERGPREGA